MSNYSSLCIIISTLVQLVSQTTFSNAFSWMKMCEFRLIFYWSAPSHYLSQCSNIVNWTLRNKLQWNLNRNSYSFIQENVFENVVCKMASISSRPQCVKIFCDIQTAWQLVFKLHPWNNGRINHLTFDFFNNRIYIYASLNWVKIKSSPAMPYLVGGNENQVISQTVTDRETWLIFKFLMIFLLNSNIQSILN